MKTTSATTLNHFKFLHQNYTSTRPQLDQTPGGVMLAPVYNPYSWPMSVGALPMRHCAYWGVDTLAMLVFPYEIVIWRPPSLSELPPIIFDMGLTHLGSEATM